ncbi:hypothetical protein ACIA8K_12520 [Catenuloplanes sp. NPDC051500]|uniref:hypothetical protein n=1 Tax=Catenuloplanes sp. NPDC051500 TaxID=3363959 RepID=UPI0037919991
MSKPFVVTVEKTFTWQMVLVGGDEFDVAEQARAYTGAMPNLPATPGVTETPWTVTNAVSVGGDPLAEPGAEQA